MSAVKVRKKGKRIFSIVFLILSCFSPIVKYQFMSLVLSPNSPVLNPEVSFGGVCVYVCVCVCVCVCVWLFDLILHTSHAVSPRLSHAEGHLKLTALFFSGLPYLTLIPNFKA